MGKEDGAVTFTGNSYDPERYFAAMDIATEENIPDNTGAYQLL